MKRLLTAILLTSLMAISAPAFAGGAQALGFKSHVEVGGGWVTLYDLASGKEKLSPELANALKGQTVMRAPRLGRDAEVKGGKLKALIRGAKLPKGVTVLIPPRISIERRTKVLTAAKLTGIYREALIRHLGPRARNADIYGISSGRDLKLPAGKVTTDVRFVTGRDSGRVPANVTVMVEGKRVAQVRVVGQVDIYADVLVATRSLGRRQIISGSDLKTMRVNVSDLGGIAATDPDEVVGMRTRKIIAAGTPVVLENLERAPLIRRGDVVMMVYRGGGLKITAKGKANQTGYKNSRISLTNMASKREVYGTVIDSGTVLVRF